MQFVIFLRATAFTALLALCSLASAQNPQDCSKVPDYNKLKAALTSAVKEGKGANGGLGNQEWGTVVNRDGIVCTVVFTGPNRGAEWPGSRLISAEKANTANAFSTDNFALSSGNVYSAAQPGNSLYSIVSGPDQTPHLRAIPRSSVSRMIHWWESRLAESSFSAEGWLSTTRRDGWWELWA